MTHSRPDQGHGRASIITCPHGGMVAPRQAPNPPRVPCGARVRHFHGAGLSVHTLALVPHPCVTVRWSKTALKGKAGDDVLLATDSIGMCYAADGAGGAGAVDPELKATGNGGVANNSDAGSAPDRRSRPIATAWPEAMPAGFGKPGAVARRRVRRPLQPAVFRSAPRCSRPPAVGAMRCSPATKGHRSMRRFPGHPSAQQKRWRHFPSRVGR